MTNDEFMKLFQYLEEFRKDVDLRFEEARKDRQGIKATVAELGGQINDYRQEMMMLSHRAEHPSS